MEKIGRSCLLRCTVNIVPLRSIRGLVMLLYGLAVDVF